MAEFSIPTGCRRHGCHVRSKPSPGAHGGSAQAIAGHCEARERASPQATAGHRDGAWATADEAVVIA